MGDCIVISKVTVRLANGYGAIKDAGTPLCDGVWRAADLGFMRGSRCNMNIRVASPEMCSPQVGWTEYP